MPIVNAKGCIRRIAYYSRYKLRRVVDCASQYGINAIPRVVTIRLRVPEWVSDEEIERIVREIGERLESSVPIDVLREMLGVREEDLVDVMEPIGEKERDEEVGRSWLCTDG